MALYCGLRALHALHPPLSARCGTGILQCASYHAFARNNMRHRYATTTSAAATGQRSFAAPAAAAATAAPAAAAATPAAPAAAAATAAPAAAAAASAALAAAKPAATAAASTSSAPAAPAAAASSTAAATAAAAQRSSTSSTSSSSSSQQTAAGSGDAVSNLTLMQAASSSTTPQAPVTPAAPATTVSAAAEAAANPASTLPSAHYWQSAKKAGVTFGSGTLKGTSWVLHYTGRGIKWFLGFISLTPRFKNVLLKTGVGDEDVALLIARMSALSIYTTISMSVMSAVGIDYSPVLAVTGLAGATIGFAAREILGGFMMGANLLLFRRFERGDLITIDGTTGIVEGLDLSRLNLRDPDTRALTQIPATKAFTFPIILHQPPSQDADIQPPTLATLPQRVEEHRLAPKSVVRKIKRYEVKSKGEREHTSNSPMGTLYESSSKSDDDHEDDDDKQKEKLSHKRSVKWLARS